MKRKASALYRSRGFTLVELIVVLVILSILAAVTVPAFTGYITKSKYRTAMNECRSCVSAAQTLAKDYNVFNKLHFWYYAPTDDSAVPYYLEDADFKITLSAAPSAAGDAAGVGALPGDGASIVGYAGVSGRVLCMKLGDYLRVEHMVYQCGSLYVVYGDDSKTTSIKKTGLLYETGKYRVYSYAEADACANNAGTQITVWRGAVTQPTPAPTPVLTPPPETAEQP